MKSPGNGRRGSALLIVFVFAAMIAIMLYREMPVAAFEAQREKEELLIDRGNEYQHAVKLFVRKFGMFPASIQALEDTNRIRFLRQKYTDPFTGKNDWRMLHAGPGGMIIDSKVKSNLNPLSGNSNGSNGTGNATGSNTTTNGNTTNGTTATNSTTNTSNTGFAGFSNSIAQPTAANGTDGTVVAPIPQRAPAVAANGNNAAIESGKPPGDSQQLPVPGADAATDPAATGNPTANVPVNTPVNPGVNPSDPQAVLRTLLSTSPNPAAPQQQGQPLSPTTPTAGNGTMTGGGIAGVASIAKGHSIKLVNDQDNFSLWEFYYDLTKEANAAMKNATANQNNANQNNANQNNANQNQSGFGSNNSSTINSSNNTTTPSQSASPVSAPPIPPPQ
jgi:hypothetical protein